VRKAEELVDEPLDPADEADELVPPVAAPLPEEPVPEPPADEPPEEPDPELPDDELAAEPVLPPPLTVSPTVPLRAVTVPENGAVRVVSERVFWAWITVSLA
jgi:hypothetical protein